MAEIEPQAVAEPAVVGEHRPRCDADLVGQRLPIDGVNGAVNQSKIDPK
jgi:hypothetical protein